LNIKDWVLQNAIPLVGRLTGNNFPLYNKLNLPMLMMFLNLEHEDRTSSPGRVVGGKSGGVFNELLLEEFRIAAKEHHHRITFVYLDGNEHADKMKSLGLYGGRERYA
jgi:Thioredoxin-like domain